jgi:hypothetical protein
MARCAVPVAERSVRRRKRGAETRVLTRVPPFRFAPGVDRAARCPYHLKILASTGGSVSTLIFDVCDRGAVNGCLRFA